jgi:hypothetical protein
MDTLLGIFAGIIMMVVAISLVLIYLELRHRRLFGPAEIYQTAPVATPTHNDTAAIAMSLQSELERLRADIHGSLTAVSTDLEQVRDQLTVAAASQASQPQATIVPDLPRPDPERSGAITELYGALSNLDTAFLAVSQPTLLPGESWDEDAALPAEAFDWQSWNDVGAAAYQFAEVFSRRRIQVDPVTRDHLNKTISSIRRILTTQLYPALTDVDRGIPEENRDQVLVLVRGLGAELADARVVLEHAAGGVSVTN